MLHLFQFSLILNISLGVLTIAVQMVHRSVLSHRAQASLSQFFVDLVHSLWLIGYLIQTLTYPGTSIQIALPCAFPITKDQFIMQFGLW